MLPRYDGNGFLALSCFKEHQRVWWFPQKKSGETQRASSGCVSPRARLQARTNEQMLILPQVRKLEAIQLNERGCHSTSHTVPRPHEGGLMSIAPPRWRWWSIARNGQMPRAKKITGLLSADYQFSTTPIPSPQCRSYCLLPNRFAFNTAPQHSSRLSKTPRDRPASHPLLL